MGDVKNFFMCDSKKVLAIAKETKWSPCDPLRFLSANLRHKKKNPELLHQKKREPKLS